MNAIDNLAHHLQYDAHRRVVLINADDFRRPGDLAFLNVHNDILVIVGQLKRLHRWKGVDYPQAEIFRFFIEDAQGTPLSTSTALAAEGISLAQRLPALKHLPWLVLSDSSEGILASLRGAGIRKCQSCTLQRSAGGLSVYQDVVGKEDVPLKRHDACFHRDADSSTSERTLGGLAPKKLRGYKHEYPAQLTEAGEHINKLVVQRGGGFPISLSKLGQLVEQHRELLPVEAVTMFETQRGLCRTASRAAQRLAKQTGFLVQDCHVVGSVS